MVTGSDKGDEWGLQALTVPSDEADTTAQDMSVTTLGTCAREDDTDASGSDCITRCHSPSPNVSERPDETWKAKAD
jgi:hypothetical protein